MTPQQIEEASRLLNIQNEAEKILQRYSQTGDELLEVQIVGVFEGTKPHSTSSGCYTQILGCLPSVYLNDIVDRLSSDAAKKLKELGVEI